MNRAHLYSIVVAMACALNAIALGICGLLNIVWPGPLWELPEFGRFQMASSTAFSILSLGVATIIVCHIMLRICPLQHD